MYINLTKRPDLDFPEWYINGMHDFFKGEPRESGLEIYEDVFDSTMFCLQRKNEMCKMLQVAKQIKPKVVMEIGSDKGGSLYHWCQIPGVKRVIAIEFRGTPYHKEFEKAFPDIDFLFISGSSYDKNNVAEVKKWLGKDKIDSLFIDGDKLGFLKDFYAYKPMMNHPSRIFMHDINGEPPEQDFKQLENDDSYITYRIYDTSEVEPTLKAVNEGKQKANNWTNWLNIWKCRSCGVGVIEL
jgi:hypothetical protein